MPQPIGISTLGTTPAFRLQPTSKTLHFATSCPSIHTPTTRHLTTYAPPKANSPTFQAYTLRSMSNAPPITITYAALRTAQHPTHIAPHANRAQPPAPTPQPLCTLPYSPLTAQSLSRFSPHTPQLNSRPNLDKPDAPYPDEFSPSSSTPHAPIPLCPTPRSHASH